MCCGKQRKEKDTNMDTQAVTINQWIDAARDSTELDLNHRKAYLKRATEMAFAITNDTLRLDHLSRISLAYKRLNDSLGFRKMNERVVQLSKKGRLYKALGESHWDMAAFLKSHGVMDSAYFHYQKAHKSFQMLPVDSTSLSLRGRILYGMGNIQEYFQDFLGAEVHITEALRIFEDLEDYRRIYNCNNLLGIVSNGMNNHPKSLEYYQKAGYYIKKFVSENQQDLLWENKNNIAHVFLKDGQYLKAKEAYSELFSDKALQKENPALYNKVTLSLGHVLFKGNSNFPKAEELVRQAVTLNDSMGFSEDQARAKQFYSEIIAAKGDSLKAKRYALESLKISKETLNTNRHLEVLRFLTSLDSENAVAYSNEFYDLSEKVKVEERAQRDKFARIRLETDEVISQNEALTRGKFIWTLVALGLLLAGIAIYIIFAQRASNNKLKYEQKQQEANQEIYNLMLSQQGKFEEGKQLEKKRISEELHDGVLGEMLGIRLFLSGLNDKADEDAVEQRAGLIEKLREVEEDIRGISHELSDASYQKFYNFIVSLEDLIHTISESSGMKCSLTYDETVDWDDLEGDIKINAYRIVQESLKNCVKHAEAESAEVKFMLREEMLQLTISDNGVGFDSNKGKKGIGFRNLLSRVQKMGGTLHIDSAKGKGTTLTVTLEPKYIVRQDPKEAPERKVMVNV
ncbi:Histidine kinase [Flagellimonas flava]|uniref:Oxygen sensor histidine kinase NreB n=2 Tax=Flagellimonas flava TaxID=570519 RepID=A0A1M5IBT6_9FLAO|nr:Histidine kinase [Allomuricauda flava]